MKDNITYSNTLVKLAKSYRSAPLANVFFQQDANIEKELECLNLAINLNPLNAEAFKERGMLFRRKRDNQNAYNDLNNYIKINPDDLNIFLIKEGICPEKSKIDLINISKIIESGPRVIDLGVFGLTKHVLYEALLIRSAHYESIGKNELAICDLEKAKEVIHEAIPDNMTGNIKKAELKNKIKFLQKKDLLVQHRTDFKNAISNFDNQLEEISKESFPDSNITISGILIFAFDLFTFKLDRHDLDMPAVNWNELLTFLIPQIQEYLQEEPNEQMAQWMLEEILTGLFREKKTLKDIIENEEEKLREFCLN